MNLDRDYPGNDDIEEIWAIIPVVGLFFLLLGLLATAVVGGILQVALGKRSGRRSTKIGS